MCTKYSSSNGLYGENSDDDNAIICWMCVCQKELCFKSDEWFDYATISA